MSDLSVRIAKPFEGLRHDRLYAIWEAIAEYWSEFLTVGFSLNAGCRWSHAQMFNKMWAEELQQGAPYVLLTEHDFLPNLWAPEWYSDLHEIFQHLDAEHGKEFAGLACEYATRNPYTKALRFRGCAGGWWVLFEKERFNDVIDFTGRPDPCNQLEEAIGGVYLCEGTDSYPQDYGIKYPFGHHLFWSRHLNDRPDRMISGFNLGDIQMRHDRAVREYVENAPEEFQVILRRNHASLF